ELALKERALTDELARKYPGEPKKVQAELEAWRKQNNPGKTPLSVLIDHIDHIVKVAGIDHVGLGSDFDGVPFTGLPEGLEDISKLLAIRFKRRSGGYWDGKIKKIRGDNLLGVRSEWGRVSRDF